MKKLPKLALSHLSEVRLDERKMGQILGGGNYICQCGCHYQGQPGGSSDSSNDSANDAGGMYSDVCQEKQETIICDYEIPHDCTERVSSLCPHGSNSCWF